MEGQGTAALLVSLSHIEVTGYPHANLGWPREDQDLPEHPAIPPVFAQMRHLRTLITENNQTAPKCQMSLGD